MSFRGLEYHSLSSSRIDFTPFFKKQKNNNPIILVAAELPPQQLSKTASFHGSNLAKGRRRQENKRKEP